MLEADGLVIRAARKGVSVTPMSRRDLDEALMPAVSAWRG